MAKIKMTKNNDLQNKIEQPLKPGVNSGVPRG